MAAGAWTLTDTARSKILNGQFDLNTDSFKIALFLSTSNLTVASTTYAGVTNEHANANGYTTGGKALTCTVNVVSTTNANWDVDDQVWTASGGPITAKWAAIYEVGGDVVAFFLLDSGGADVTATDGNTFTFTCHASGVVVAA